MDICWGLGLLVIVTRVSTFFSNSGWWWAFECMEENLRIRMDDVLWSSETLINSFWMWSSIKSLAVHCEATVASLHYFRLYGGFIFNWFYGGFIFNWYFWEHISLAPSFVRIGPYIWRFLIVFLDAEVACTGFFILSP